MGRGCLSAAARCRFISWAMIPFAPPRATEVSPLRHVKYYCPSPGPGTVASSRPNTAKSAVQARRSGSP